MEKPDGIPIDESGATEILYRDNEYLKEEVRRLRNIELNNSEDVVTLEYLKESSLFNVIKWKLKNRSTK